MTALVGSYVEDFKGMAVKATQFQDATGAVIAFTSGAGSSTDNAVARYDGTAGAFQNSGILVSDTNAVTGVLSLTTTGAANTIFNSTSLDSDFTVKALTSGNAIAYDSGADTLALGKTATAVTVNGGVTFADGTTDVDIASHDGTNGLKLGGVLVTPSAAELNTLKASAKFVAATGTITVTAASHAGKVIKLDTATGSIATLPAATGSGNVYEFVVSALATSNSHKIQVANASDTMQGFIFTMDDTTDNAQAFFAVAASSDTITLNRTTTGSVTKGERIKITDFAANLFHVEGFISNTGTAATPFSAAV